MAINDLNEKLLNACRDIKNQPDYDGYLDDYCDAIKGVSNKNKVEDSKAKNNSIELENFTYKDAIKLIFFLHNLLHKLENQMDDFQDGYQLPNCFTRVEGQQLSDVIGSLSCKFECNIYTKCEYCDGDGSSEELSCSMPASECCGGCSIVTECNECEGKGFLILDK